MYPVSEFWEYGVGVDGDPLRALVWMVGAEDVLQDVFQLRSIFNPEAEFRIILDGIIPVIIRFYVRIYLNACGTGLEKMMSEVLCVLEGRGGGPCDTDWMRVIIAHLGLFGGVLERMGGGWAGRLAGGRIVRLKYC